MRAARHPRVLCAQSVGDAAHPFDSAQKLDAWARSVPHDEFRPHPWDYNGPMESLASLFARAGTIVTWTSTIGVDALLAGIHVEAHGPACYKGVESEGRLDFFSRLAYSQWTMAEMRAGLPIQRLLDERHQDSLRTASCLARA